MRSPTIPFRTEHEAAGERRRSGPASRGARATARWRERRAQGSLVVPVELFAEEVEALVRTGWLDPRYAAARPRIGRAVADLVEHVVEGLHRAGTRR